MFAVYKDVALRSANNLLAFLLFDDIMKNKKRKEVCTLSKNEFLNFAEISKAIVFSDVLDWLNIPYTKRNGELRGEDFIVSIEKNLFFSPKNDCIKGSVINFVSNTKQIELREAALLLRNEFLSNKKDTIIKRDIPELLLEHHSYLSSRQILPEIAKEYEVGYVKQRSVVAGRIAFKMYDSNGSHIGYIGYKKENDNWFYPKNFKRPLYNLQKRTDKKAVIVTTDPFDALRIISLDIPQVVSLLASTMTAEQEVELRKFKFILLLHTQPENIVSRLFQTSFVKAPTLTRPLSELSNQELLNLIKPSS